MHSRFRGLVAAPFTPFHADGSLNLDVIPAYARFLADNGVGAAFVCGTTGESLSLTLEERLAVAARWVACADERLRVIVHVGHNCLTDARTLTAHAAKIGAVAVAALAPMFFKPRSNAEVVEWCAAVTSAAPSLPLLRERPVDHRALPCPSPTSSPKPPTASRRSPAWNAPTKISRTTSPALRRPAAASTFYSVAMNCSSRAPRPAHSAPSAAPYN